MFLVFVSSAILFRLSQKALHVRFSPKQVLFVFLPD